MTSVGATFAEVMRARDTLDEFSRALDFPGASHLDIAGIDVVAIAEAYGVPAHRAESLDKLTDVVKVGVTGPRLVEVREHP
jgi:benzoylformate decarboxylase